MKRFLATLVLGSLLATLGEFLFCVLVRQSVSDYLFTLAAYPVILALVFLPMRWIERHMPTALASDVTVYAFAGLLGLAIEWFGIGNSPWANPEAHDLGMFCYWATVLAMPRLFLDARPYLLPVRRSAGIAFAGYAAAALAVGLLTPPPLRLFVLVWVVVLGYTGMNLFFARSFYLTWKAARTAEALALAEGAA